MVSWEIKGRNKVSERFIIPVDKWPTSFKYVYRPEGEYVNDHCIIKEKGIYHLFYISGDFRL